MTSIVIQTDKVAHFGISSTLTMTCEVATKPILSNHFARDLACGAIVMAIGGMKELYDYNGHGMAEAGDVYADFGGVAFGIAILHLDF